MADRPVECSQCKKSIKITYKEIVDDSIICTEMCPDCPILQAKLHGEAIEAKKKESGLCCGNCGNSLESVQMGQPLGCTECYAIFGNFLVAELLQASALPPSIKKNSKRTIHIGKSPNKPAEVALSSKLSSLNEALNDALKRENYEQAAWLRDQIKALTDKQP